jgi:hypothetical protein
MSAQTIAQGVAKIISMPDEENKIKGAMIDGVNNTILFTIDPRLSISRPLEPQCHITWQGPMVGIERRLVNGFFGTPEPYLVVRLEYVHNHGKEQIDG